AVYLFGSVANKTNTVSSDIDVCIVSKTFGKDRASERVKLMLLREGISDLFEPHPLSVAEFESSINPFSLEVKRKGIRVL
ncbi:MAG: nucleotidyltransferase domain-containing protein, partial [Patescibacteria group bacterium]